MTPTRTVVHDPLMSTFCFSPGIGLGTEQKLWENGIVHWDHVAGDAVAFLNADRARQLKKSVEAARRDLEGGRPDFFRDRMDNAELWRAYPHFKRQCVYLDIETTGLDVFSKVTMIGMYDGTRLVLLERGKDLEHFPKLISKYSMIITFNGRSFDVPFLRREFPNWRPTQVHWDLRWALKALGFEGGLKDIEARMGLKRPGPLSRLGGFDAVLLWNAYRKGDTEALEILRRYLAEDVLGLKPLAERAFNGLAAEHPLEVSELSLSARPSCDLKYNARAIDRLVGY